MRHPCIDFVCDYCGKPAVYKRTLDTTVHADNVEYAYACLTHAIEYAFISVALADGVLNVNDVRWFPSPASDAIIHVGDEVSVYAAYKRATVTRITKLTSATATTNNTYLVRVCAAGEHANAYADFYDHRVRKLES
jgi:hypothetical protein